VMTGEEVQWGAENLNIDAARIKALGVEGMLQPIKTSCSDHEGARRARIHTWDGSKWSYTSDWYEADSKLLRPMIEAAAKKYGAEKKVEARKC
jgi:branched-chain amino acid transport system substrate-binding protein